MKKVYIKELRDGNYIMPNSREFVPEYNGTMTQVDLDIRYYGETAYDENEGEYLSQYEPIPLTPEILERCGFECDASYQVPHWTHKSGFYFHDDCFTQGIFSIRILNAIDVEFKYLHQLQNLYYSLCQKELTITI